MYVNQVIQKITKNKTGVLLLCFWHTNFCVHAKYCNEGIGCPAVVYGFKCFYFNIIQISQINRFSKKTITNAIILFYQVYEKQPTHTTLF